MIALTFTICTYVLIHFFISLFSQLSKVINIKVAKVALNLTNMLLKAFKLSDLLFAVFNGLVIK
jgi:hypothetical protein